VMGFLRHLPNTLSALRLIAAPLTAYLILGGYDTAALVVFAAAGLSDALDGYLAKTFSLTSKFGAWLDPAADKLLMLASFLTLSAVGASPWWLAAVVIGRDVVIVAGVIAALAMRAPLEVKPLIVGKVSTVIQVIYVGLLLLLAATNLRAPGLAETGVALVAGFAVGSLLAYAHVWLKAVTAGGRRTI
jgi:cardiolipin synthase (CMP-forming)